MQSLVLGLFLVSFCRGQEVDPVERVNQWTFSRSLLNANRTEGISLFFRAKNSGEFIYQAVKSSLPGLDEAIVVFNQCQDNTEEEVRRLLRDFPDKVKAFHYVPHVYPAGSEGHRKTPPSSMSSIVNYYNFALMKTTKTVVAKGDADQIMIPTAYSRVLSEVRKRLVENKEKTYLTAHGVNLCRLDSSGGFGVVEGKELNGETDWGFWRVVDDTMYFKHDDRWEVLNIPPERPRQWIDSVAGGVIWYHVKYVQKDFGLYNYAINDKSSYLASTQEFFERRCLDIADTLEKYHIEAPERLGINYSNCIMSEFAVHLTNNGIDWKRSYPWMKPCREKRRALGLLNNPRLRNSQFNRPWK